MSQERNHVLKYGTAASQMESKNSLQNVILLPSLKKRIKHLARATANAKTRLSPSMNMLFYGPPGTGKTMVAREIAQKSGLDYAMMTTGCTGNHQNHEIFYWSKKSNKGLLLY